MNEANFLKVSVQSALIERVTNNLHAVSAGIRDKAVLIHAYFCSTPSEEEVEDIDDAATEIIADFPEEFRIEERCFSIDQKEIDRLDFLALLH